MAEQTLNIPQLIAVVLVGFLAIRWFLSPASPNQNASSRNAGRQVNPAHVEQIAQMFPQLDRRAIVWDLLRNGGSLQATTERLLSGRSLDTRQPPTSFQPPIPLSTAPTASTSTTPKPSAAHPDLITRYNLSSKITTPPSTPGASDVTSSSVESKPGWSANRNERAEILKRRREEMVLAARRKMEEKDRKAQSAA
ncbi:hypothetical protein M8818_003632 [Zalaria obscura]|uniref:Uncharacterized protein n=1 Tax=Zalaria obscura TaxID=2024903 RepID=A0ACC3SEU2_9PEZI